MDLKDIGYRMKLRREFLGWSLSKTADKIGASPASIMRWENGEIGSIKTTKLEEIADALSTTVEYLLGVDEERVDLSGLERLPEFRLVPILGEISCGQPIICEQNYEESVLIPKSSPCDFIVRAKGDSMINARIFDGDLVLIKQQSSVCNGDIAAVLIDNEVTLKRFYLYSNRIELRPENPTYQPLNFEGDSLLTARVIGKAIQVLGELK